MRKILAADSKISYSRPAGHNVMGEQAYVSWGSIFYLERRAHSYQMESPKSVIFPFQASNPPLPIANRVVIDAKTYTCVYMKEAETLKQFD